MAEDEKNCCAPDQVVTENQETKISGVNVSLKEVRVSSILQGLLDEHKTQSLVVDTLKSELHDLEQNPQLFFQNRKRFLYHAYTQTLDECKVDLKFDVKVLRPDYVTDNSLTPATPYLIEKWVSSLATYINSTQTRHSAVFTLGDPI